MDSRDKQNNDLSDELLGPDKRPSSSRSENPNRTRYVRDSSGNLKPSNPTYDEPTVVESSRKIEEEASKPAVEEPESVFEETEVDTETEVTHPPVNVDRHGFPIGTSVDVWACILALLSGLTIGFAMTTWLGYAAGVLSGIASTILLGFYLKLHFLPAIMENSKKTDEEIREERVLPESVPTSDEMDPDLDEAERKDIDKENLRLAKERKELMKRDEVKDGSFSAVISRPWIRYPVILFLGSLLGLLLANTLGTAHVDKPDDNVTVYDKSGRPLGVVKETYPEPKASDTTQSPAPSPTIIEKKETQQVQDKSLTDKVSNLEKQLQEIKNRPAKEIVTEKPAPVKNDTDKNSATKDDVSDLKSQIDGVKSEVAGVSPSVEDLKSRIDKLEKDLANQSQELQKQKSEQSNANKPENDTMPTSDPSATQSPEGVGR